MSYRDALPPEPTEWSRETARDYHAAIVELLDRRGWTRSERTMLQRLAKRWRRRRDGHDLRWLAVGPKSGRLDRELEAVVLPKRRKHPDWS